jgi:hypothetical protein
VTTTRDPTIVYITSRGHSGSTLLDLLLSSHSDAVSVGEARFSPKFETTKCSCAAPSVWECPFWHQVDADLRQRIGITLRELDIRSEDPAEFLAHNKAFYAAVAAVTGKRVIVDSSKNPERLGRMLETGAFDVRAIHLLRRPHGVVFSYIRRGLGGWVTNSIEYTQRVRATRRFLRGKDHRVVRYEDLIATTPETVRDLMPWIGLTYEPGQLAFGNRERHNCGGNKMRFTADGTIRLDRAWETGLRPWQKLGISLITLPTRFV